MAAEMFDLLHVSQPEVPGETPKASVGTSLKNQLPAAAVGGIILPVARPLARLAVSAATVRAKAGRY